METKKKITEDERRQHQHFIIQEWKKNVAQTKTEFHSWLETDNARLMFKELREENERRGVILSEDEL